MKIRNALAIVVATVVSVALLAGCTAGDSWAEHNAAGDSKGYVAGSGITEYTPKANDRPIDFAGTLLNGRRITAADYRGKVLVVNFWYASCPPCRLEAAGLEKASTSSASTTAFLGVNVKDEVDTAAAYVRSFRVTYDNLSDVSTGRVQLAFAGTRGPNSTPSTIVLNPKGQVTARILGGVDESTLRSLIETASAPSPTS